MSVGRVLGSAARYAEVLPRPEAPPPVAVVPGVYSARPEVAPTHVPATRAIAVRALVASPTWAAANAAERRALLGLLDRLDAAPLDAGPSAGHTAGHNGYDAFIALCRRQRDDRPLLLARTDGGATILDMLTRFTVDPALVRRVEPLTAAAIFSTLLLEVADPDRIEQAEAGTCAVTSLQHHLAEHDPAEYVRVMTDLMSAGARVTLRGGDVVRRDDNAIVSTGRTTRSASERVFQSAMMQAELPKRDYATDGAREGVVEEHSSLYDSLHPFWKILAALTIIFAIIFALIPRRRLREPGLDDAGVTHAASQLFGRRYDTAILDGETDRLAWLRARVPDGDFRGRGWFVGLIPFGNGGGHEMMIERIDYAGRPPVLICRNPWGSSPLSVRGQPIGAPAPGDVVVEDPARGTVRIPLTDANLRMFHAVHFPVA
ncbi:MAG: hypothetical protein IT381_09610 [Deltaproteobacteria bacterium]|nr:hypothetical protein [Deltaproteobacteria bacterium]